LGKPLDISRVLHIYLNYFYQTHKQNKQYSTDAVTVTLQI